MFRFPREIPSFVRKEHYFHVIVYNACSEQLSFWQADFFSSNIQPSSGSFDYIWISSPSIDTED